MLGDLGIDVAEIDQHATFSAEKFGQLYQRAMYITQDEYFGMLSGGKLPTGTFRIMCHAIINCKNLGHAIQRASDFHDIVKGTKIKPKLEKRGQLASVSFTGVTGLDHAQISALIAKQPTQVCTSLSMWHHFISWLIGERVALNAVTFSFLENQAPPNCATRFQSKVRFSHSQNAIVFPASYLDFPLVQTEATLRGFLKTAPYQLLVMVDDSVSLTTQVVALIGRDFSILPPSAEQVAQTLNMSLSTLRRRLLAENTSFQKIKDDCRKNSAIQHMRSPQLSINDVAELMGFDEPSAFFRSFKRWTGMTPGEFRQQKIQAEPFQAIDR